MPRFAAPIALDRLVELVNDAGGVTLDSSFNINLVLDGCPRLHKDLREVEFDFENYNRQKCDEFGRWVGMLGPQQIGDLTFLGNMAGGDWEQPLYFIIYLDYDGKTLRAYIPRDGNPWNQVTWSAFGNNDEADLEFIQNKLGPGQVCCLDDADSLFSGEKIFAEITAQITVAAPPPPGKVSVELMKEAKVADDTLLPKYNQEIDPDQRQWLPYQRWLALKLSRLIDLLPDRWSEI